MQLWIIWNLKPTQHGRLTVLFEKNRYFLIFELMLFEIKLCIFEKTSFIIIVSYFGFWKYYITTIFYICTKWIGWMVSIIPSIVSFMVFFWENEKSILQRVLLALLYIENIFRPKVYNYINRLMNYSYK